MEVLQKLLGFIFVSVSLVREKFEKTRENIKHKNRAVEIIGSSPMSLDLMTKVQATTQKLPVLKDLRTDALKERHWKQISEVIY